MKKWILTFLMAVISITMVHGETGSVKFTDQEQAWLSQHRSKPITMGLDPYLY